MAAGRGSQAARIHAKPPSCRSAACGHSALPRLTMTLSRRSQLLAVAGVHPPLTQFCQRHGTAVAAFAGQQVALYLCATHRGVSGSDHDGITAWVRPHPRQRSRRIVIGSARTDTSGSCCGAPVGCCRTPHTPSPGVPAASYLGTQRSGSFPGQYRVSVSYWWKGDRVVSNHDSRSPFFSLFSLTYSKAIISSSFHYQNAGADSSTRHRPGRRSRRMRCS